MKIYHQRQGIYESKMEIGLVPSGIIPTVGIRENKKLKLPF
jgi:hypothetical protein